ncbi:hypothetical protein BLX87_02225 [Bacillus sp. VT-16-64]|nr:hypothetical protein BLX87_02225 [Bacillus sp. VT-16-64]
MFLRLIGCLVVDGGLAVSEVRQMAHFQKKDDKRMKSGRYGFSEICLLLSLAHLHSGVPWMISARGEKPCSAESHLPTG